MTTAIKKYIKHKGEPLTTDEVAVLQEVARSGAPYKDIARDLGISSTSVSVTLSHVSRKVGVRRRHGLTVWAYQAGIVDVQSINLNGGGNPWTQRVP